jgi:hypothetical protein
MVRRLLGLARARRRFLPYPIEPLLILKPTARIGCRLAVGIDGRRGSRQGVAVGIDQRLVAEVIRQGEQFLFRFKLPVGHRHFRLELNYRALGDGDGHEIVKGAGRRGATLEAADSLGIVAAHPHAGG